MLTFLLADNSKNTDEILLSEQPLSDTLLLQTVLPLLVNEHDYDIVLQAHHRIAAAL